SDDSLQYLSAEEKACLMFLEETIESLDTDDDDSGLSNDEVEVFRFPGNMATKAAYLSASMDQRKQKGVPKHYIDDPRIFGSSEHNQILNYLVPTPFVLANGNAYIPPKSGTGSSKEIEHKSDKEAPRVPSEVNVVVIPPPFVIKSSNEKNRGLQNDQFSRGPLTYEGLVQLRRRVATRKEHETQPSAYSNDGTHVFSQNLQLKENRSNKISPPAVAPKPKNIPSHIAVLNHKETTDPNADSTMHCLSTSPGSRGLMKPEKVRLEALSKLGLLKESDSKPFTNGQFTERHTPCVLQPSSGSTPDMSQSRPVPPCVAVRNEELRSQPNQGRNILHCSMTGLATVPARSHHTKLAGGKAATLERSGMGLGSSKSNSELSDDQSHYQNHLQSSSTLVQKNNLENIQTGTLCNGKPQALSGQSSIAPPVPQKPSRTPGLNVMMAPNMGQDRREALRKLGLLKR
ncbi:hypothetical protein NFI96_021217, partial [Prochilodus magdalenae]